MVGVGSVIRAASGGEALTWAGPRRGGGDSGGPEAGQSPGDRSQDLALLSSGFWTRAAALTLGPLAGSGIWGSGCGALS